MLGSTHKRGTVGFDAQLTSEWYAWHDARVVELATPFGMLSITDIQWVQPGQSGRWFDLPGEFSFDGTWMHFRVDPGQTVGPAVAALEVIDAPDSAPVSATHSDNTFSARVDRNASLNWLISGHVMVELINREGYVALRKRDSKAPLLSRFIDVPTFPLDEEWIVTGTFTPFDEPQTRHTGSATPGLDREETFPGTVTFELGGKTHTLYASGSAENGLYINFFDYTNGTTTPGWRRLGLGVPNRAGDVIVDFNRAIVYPMAFTPYATCPAPVVENQLPLAVEAGERKPAQTLSQTGVNTPVLLVRTGGEVFYEHSVDYLRELGVDVTFADATGDEIVPPLTGYSALVVVGYDTPESGGVSDEVIELVSDATGASVPVVAIGNVATALAKDLRGDSDDWRSSLESTDFSVATVDNEHNVSAGPVYDVAVNDVVARDRLFAQIVRYDEGGTSYIPLREMEHELRQEPGEAADSASTASASENIQWSTRTTWQDLIERFARLVHSQI